MLQLFAFSLLLHFFFLVVQSSERETILLHQGLEYFFVCSDRSVKQELAGAWTADSLAFRS